MGLLHNTLKLTTLSLLRIIICGNLFDRIICFNTKRKNAISAKIMDAITVGDFHAVAREVNVVTENSGIVMEIFFSSEGKAGIRHKETGSDSIATAETKAEFEKYY